MSQSDLWFVFQNETLLLDMSLGYPRVPTGVEISAIGLEFEIKHLIGSYHETSSFAVQARPLVDIELPTGFIFLPIRQALLSFSDDHIFYLVSRGRELLHWIKRTQFCGCCGAQTRSCQDHPANACPSCHALFFPQISPAMLVVIWRGDEILLGRSAHFLPGVYSALAGFVDPGESLEACVVREVQEEVGLCVKNIQYFSSQSWPFPSNLMLGFFAEYESGDIQVDQNELEDAQWFNIHNLPALPNTISLSRRVIDAHVWFQRTRQ